MKRGFPVIISAPSGAGKSTICHKLLSRSRGLTQSVSWTTRAPRPGEVDGKHYVFVSEKKFATRAKEGGFLETAYVHGHWYGTPAAPVEAAVRKGKKVLMAIDVQGGASISSKLPDSVRIFVLPPSWDVLAQRLKKRKDPEDSAARRLRDARAEIARAREYDYLVVNDRLGEAVREVEQILAVEALRVKRNAALLSRFN